MRRGAIGYIIGYTDRMDTMTHACGNCQRYTAIVAHDDGSAWAHDFQADGHTPTTDLHRCGEQDRRHA